MKPEKQSIPINFANGLDTKTDPWQVGPLNFLTLENSVFTVGGRLTKRNGYEEEASDIFSQYPYSYQAFGSTLAKGKLINTFNDERVVCDGLNLFGFSESDQKNIYKGKAPINQVTTAPIFQNQYHQILADSAINTTTSMALYGWESWTRIPDLAGEYIGLTYSLVDLTTGLTILTVAMSDFYSRPKCVAIAGFLYLIYFDSTDNTLKAISVTAAQGAPTPTTLVNNIDTTLPNYDVEVIGSNIYIAYNGTGSTVKVASFSSALASVANNSISDTATNGVCLFTDTGANIWIGYNNGTETKAVIFNAALSSQTLAPTVLDNTSTAINVNNITGSYDGTRGVFLYDQQGNPVAGQYTGLTNTALFVQPAVGSTVTVNLSGNGLSLLGSIIFVENGGYYYVSGYIIAGNDIILTNLGYPGNAAPAANVGSGSKFYPTSGRINAQINYNTLTVGGVVGTVATLIKSLGLNSRSFMQNGVLNVVGSYDSPIQPIYFLLSLYNTNNGYASASAKIFEGDAGGLPYKSILPSVNIDGDGNYNVALPRRVYILEKTSGFIQVPLWFDGIFSAKIDFDPEKISSQELGEVLLIASGVPIMYDGASVVEQGFNTYPENITAVATPGSGQLSAGQYGYQVVYQWIDANGQTYKSAPSTVLSVTAAANDLFTLSIPTLRVTEKTDATITVYRTQANGSIYYRVDSQRITPGFYPVNNAPTANSISYVDGIADSQIVGNEQLYTAGEVENIAPPCASVISNYRERAILFPSDNPNSIWYSKQIVPGSPIEFSDLFVQNVDTVGGPLVTGAPMDDKFIFYKRSSIYYMTGSGPAASGQNNDFSEPLLITTDCGCVDKTSVVRTPFGHLFKSEKGIYLLDRSLSVNYIGAEVESYNQYDILSVTLISETQQVRFALSSGDVLVYDYYYKQWSVFSNLDIVSNCLYQKLHTFIRADGSVFQETPGQYLDGADPVLMSFKTSWIKLAGLQGYQRIFFFYLLAKYKSPHQLLLNIAYNFSDTPSQTTTITPDPNLLENWRVFLATQRCQSFQLDLQEVYTGTPGEGFDMSGLNLIVGVKSRFRTIAADQSIG